MRGEECRRKDGFPLTAGGNDETKKMDARLKMSGMTNADGWSMRNGGHDGGHGSFMPLLPSPALDQDRNPHVALS
jgi:hypothetical protein